MKNPLIINIRCSCIEEYINIQRLHKEYTKQLRTGEIMSVFVGAELAVPGEYAVVDKLMEKGGQCRKAPAVAFYPKGVGVADIRKITKEFTKEDFEELKKEVEKGAVIMSGPQPDEEITLPQAVDGGVDAMGNQPLPEAYGQPVPQPEVAFDPNVEDYRAENEDWKASRDVASASAPNNFEPTHFIEEPVPESLFKKVPETLTAVGTEPFSTFGPQEFNQSQPSVAEESDDGCNGEDRNYTC